MFKYNITFVSGKNLTVLTGGDPTLTVENSIFNVEDIINIETLENVSLSKVGV